MKTETTLALLLSRNPLKVVPPEHQPKTIFSVVKQRNQPKMMVANNAAQNPVMWDERWFGNYE